MARYLLLPVAESKASLEAIRGRHPKTKRKRGEDKTPKGEVYLRELRLTLQSYEDSLQWRTRMESFALAALYLEGRPRGKSFELGNVRRIASMAMDDRFDVPDKDRMRLLRIVAAPLVADGLSQDRFIYLREIAGRSTQFPYELGKLLEFAVYVWPLFQKMGKSISSVISDFLVHSWFEYHKDFWDTKPAVYESRVNVSAWSNDEKESFISELVRRDRGGYFNTSSLHLVSDYVFHDKVAGVIWELSQMLQVNLRQVEVNRIFHGLLQGETSANELPTHTEIWRGMRDPEFAKAAKAVLADKRLLDLASPKYCLQALTGRSPEVLTQELCLMSFDDEQVEQLKVRLKEVGLELDQLPFKQDYHFPKMYGILIPQEYEYRYRWDSKKLPAKDQAALTRFTGLGSVVFMMLNKSLLHERLTGHINKVMLPKADRILDAVVTEGAPHIEHTRELFHHVASRGEDSYATTESHGITLTHIDEEKAASKSPPQIIEILVKLLRAELRNRITAKLSEVLDSDWRVVATSAVNFDD